nr:PREDICTED: phosphatidylethanolamine-binding protein homolog F40A3.3-like [Bemisia tabaci]XP_018901352.1 PREDICTED: phosphatidylethanolamine-binding protein homolog F40A3.3-like [Bemisia tabaci]XP_018901353.1 PREDICTED: phosphatidylethanolamine-binding protein homolog F40A3.3-like [Bemisia tabaci]
MLWSFTLKGNMEIRKIDLIVRNTLFLCCVVNLGMGQQLRRTIPPWLRMNRGPAVTNPPKTRPPTTEKTVFYTDATTKPPTTTLPTTEMSWAIRLTYPPSPPPTLPPPNATDFSLVLLKGILINHKLMPEISVTTPRHVIKVSWDYYTQCELGNYISPKSVKKAPRVKWKREPDAWYSLIMLDIDAPIAQSHNNASYKQFLHWAVLNIQKGDDINENTTIAEYVPPAPANASGNHRIVFMLYKHRAEMWFDDWFPAKIPANIEDKRRRNFKSKNFAMKYYLTPIGVNFFRTSYEAWDGS